MWPFGSDKRQRPRPQGTVIFIAGAPGSGKTTLLVDALTVALNHDERAVALDLTGDLGRYLEGEGAEVARVRTAAEASRALLWSRVVCFTVARGARLDAVAEEWLAFCARRRRSGDWYVCDEAELVFPHNPSDAARQLIKFARNDGYTVALATQRPQLTDGLARSNAEHVCVFRGDSLAYVETGCREFGETAVFRAALDLPRHHYLYRSRYERRFDAPLPVIDSRTERAPFLGRYGERNDE